MNNDSQQHGGASLPASHGSAFTVEHSCGMWQLRRGDELGRTVIKTASMGKSIGTRYPVGINPRLMDIEARLIKANAAQFGMPNDPDHRPPLATGSGCESSVR